MCVWGSSMIVSHFIYKSRVDNVKKQSRNTKQAPELPLSAQSPVWDISLCAYSRPHIIWACPFIWELQNNSPWMEAAHVNLNLLGTIGNKLCSLSSWEADTLYLNCGQCCLSFSCVLRERSGWFPGPEQTEAVSQERSSAGQRKILLRRYQGHWP